MKNSNPLESLIDFLPLFCEKKLHKFPEHFYDTQKKKKLISKLASYFNIPTKCTHDLNKFIFIIMIVDLTLTDNCHFSTNTRSHFFFYTIFFFGLWLIMNCSLLEYHINDH